MSGFDAAVQRAKIIVAYASNKDHQVILYLSIKLVAIDSRCNVNSYYDKMIYWKSGFLSSSGLYP